MVALVVAQAEALRSLAVRAVRATLAGIRIGRDPPNWPLVAAAALVRTPLTHLRTIRKVAMADPSLMTTSLQPTQAVGGALGTTRTPVTPVVQVAVAPAKHTREAYPAP